MNIEDFRYISTIAKLGRFSAAAQELFISQPALSQRVKYIEKEYGITIFKRSANGVELTEDGTWFVKYANDILYSEASLRQHLESRRQISIDKIRIGTSQLINTYIFDLLIDTFHMGYPDIKLDIVTDTSIPLQNMLLSGELDIAVIHSVNDPFDKLTYQTIYDDQMVVVPATGSELEKKIQALGKYIYDPIPLALLQNEPFALTPEKLSLSQRLDAVLKANKISLDVQQYSKQYDFLYKLAKRGVSSTILLDSYFNPDTDYIPYYYLNADNISWPIQICYRKDSPTAVICEEFTNLVLQLNL